MLTSTQKGAIAEAVIAAEAIKAGVDVLRPLAEGGRYDLLFDTGTRFIRVQCKSAPRRGDVIVVATRTCRHTPRGYVRTTYDASEVDAIAVYCPDTNGCYFLTDRGGAREVGGSPPLGPGKKQPGVRDKLRSGLRLPWGYSSAGRARDWQSRGRRFEPG